MTTDLEVLRKLAAEATPGPWEVGHFADYTSVDWPFPDEPGRKLRIAYIDRAVFFFEGAAGSPQEHWDAGNAMREANAALIVAAVNALPALLAAADKLARVTALLRAVLDANEEEARQELRLGRMEGQRDCYSEGEMLQAMDAAAEATCAAAEAANAARAYFEEDR